MATTSTLRIAWRNLGRNRKRTFLAVSAIALGQLTFLVISALMNGYGDQYFNSITGPLIGHIQIHVPEWREDRSIDLGIDDLEARLAQLRADPNVAHAAPRMYAPVLAALTNEGFMGMVIGIDAQVESHDSGLLAGQDLSGQMGDRRVLVGSTFARKYDITPGMELALIGQDVDGSIANDLFTVTNIVSSQVDIVNSLGIVMSLEDAQEFLLMPDQAHEVLIHVKEPEIVVDVVAGLSTLPAVDGLEILPWREIVPQLVSMIDMIGAFTLTILVIVFVAAAAGITNTMLMSTYERIHEFGMLLSLGCQPNRLGRMVAVEAMLLGLVGVAVGSALAIGVVLLTMDSGLDYAALGGNDASYQIAFQGMQVTSRVIPKLLPADIGIGIVAVLFTSFISALWPMLHIVRLEPMEAMRS